MLLRLMPHPFPFCRIHLHSAVILFHPRSRLYADIPSSTFKIACNKKRRSRSSANGSIFEMLLNFLDFPNDVLESRTQERIPVGASDKDPNNLLILIVGSANMMTFVVADHADDLRG